jgi:hypothetical protein
LLHHKTKTHRLTPIKILFSSTYCGDRVIQSVQPCGRLSVVSKLVLGKWLGLPAPVFKDLLRQDATATTF